MSDFGYLYVATGEKYYLEAKQSAASLRKVSPEANIAIYTDLVEEATRSEEFTQALPVERPMKRLIDCAPYLAATPFSKTLYLDSDTFFLEPVDELEGMLDHFDIACAHAAWRSCGHDIPECTTAFPELNTGVILYSKSGDVLELFKNWERIYQEPHGEESMNDQPAFRKAMFQSKLRMYVLTPEYNLRTPFPFFAGANANVKIIHGRGAPLVRAVRQINKSVQPRAGNFNR